MRVDMLIRIFMWINLQSGIWYLPFQGRSSRSDRLILHAMLGSGGPVHDFIMRKHDFFNRDSILSCYAIITYQQPYEESFHAETDLAVVLRPLDRTRLVVRVILDLV